MSRLLADLEPGTQPLALALIEWCHSNGLPTVFPTSTLRTHPEQEALWEQGRDKPGPVVTNSPPYHSWHETGRAFDLAALAADHRGATWDLPWEQIAAYAATLGLEWGGHFAGLGDRDHFQFTDGLSLAEAMAQQDARAGAT